jgi:hypothetical protein
MAEVAGTVIELSAPDPEGIEHLRWFFGRSQIPVVGNLPPDVQLRCGITKAAVALPTETPTSVNGPVTRWAIGDATVLHHVDGRSARVTARAITVETAPPGVPAWLTCRQLLAEAVSCWWARRSSVVLHAALLGRDGQGLLVVGPTGAGKSTAMVAALYAGLDVHADDLVVVAGRHHVAHGIPKRVMLERSLSDQLAIPAHDVPGDRRDRVVLDADVLTAGPATVVGVVVVDHAADIAHVSVLPHSESLAALVASSFEAAHGHVEAVLPTVAHLAGLPAHRLAHDVSGEHRLERTGRLLVDLLGRADQ